MLKIYQRLWQVNWAEQWQYRANSIMYLLYWLVSPIVHLAVWTSIANANGAINGLTANDFATYYLLLLIVDQFTSNITIHIFAYKVQDGSLSGELVKPIHPMLTSTLINNIAFKALMLAGFIPVWIILAIIFKPDLSAVTWSGILIAIPALALGFMVNFLLSGVMSAVAFWTTRVFSVNEFYFALFVLFSGQFVPLQLMPKAIQVIAQYLPFQLQIYLPIQLLQNKLTPAEIAHGFIIGLIWLIIASVLFNRVWREGIKRYSAVGA
jgi:ABC-2 type transport system permease protein